MMTVIILILSVIFLAISLHTSFDDPNAAATMLSFFSTVIVSWLISNKANEREAKKQQEGLAKVSHRHLGDVEKSALSIEQYIKDFTYDFAYHETSYDVFFLFLKSLDSRMDDLKDKIASTNRDWYDLLSDEVKKEIRDAENPEARFIQSKSKRKGKSKSKPAPDLSGMAKYREATAASSNEADEDDMEEKADV